MTPVASLLATLAPTILDIVDKSVEDKDAAFKIKAALGEGLLRSQSELGRAAADVIMAEASGESWLQRNWRPMLMIWFSILIGVYWFGLIPANMPEPIIEKLFTLVQIGVGGYVVGRSGEKIAATIAPYMGGSDRP